MKLQESVLTGNTNRFLEICNNDPHLLHKLATVPSNDTPLHVAALHGHVSLAKEIIRLGPELAESLDSSRSSPLHLAAAKGYLEIVKMLFKAKDEMCNGLNDMGLSPAHLAVTKGRVEVVRELVRGRWARVRSDQEETVLHICVKYSQLEILKMLMEDVNEVQELVDAKDEYGNTILHLAVLEKHTKTVEYLLSTRKMDVNAKNKKECTPLDILAQSKRGVQDWAIGNLLQEAGALKSTNLVTSQPNTIQTSDNENNPQINLITSQPNIMQTCDNENNPQINLITSQPNTMQTCDNENNPQINLITSQPNTMQTCDNENNPQIPSFLRQNQNSRKNLNQNEWLAKKRDALMIVASLLAAMAFQVGVCPPGGVWQEDSIGDPNGHRAGEAVVAYKYPETYKFYIRANTISFVASLSTILLLISGLPLKRKTFMWLLMGIMWLSITSMAFTYGYAIMAVTPIKDRTALRRTMYVAIPVWCGLMGLLFVGHTIRLTQRWMKKKGIDMWDYMTGT